MFLLLNGLCSSVCVCVCVHVFTRVYISIRHICVHVTMCMHVCVCLPVTVCVHMCVVCMCMCSYMHAFWYACLHVGMCKSFYLHLQFQCHFM